MILSSFAALSLVATSFASPLDSVKRAASGISAVTDAQWAELNQTVAGKLHKGAPWARPCFALATSGTNGNLDLGQCTAVQSGWTDDLQIADAFGGMQNANWGSCQATGRQCMLDFQLPQNPLAYSPPRSCDQGSISTYYVDARRYTDVQAALAFATKYNVPISVKNSGHDYKGRSVSPGSLSIWVHNLEGPLTYSPSVVAAGCSNAGVPAIKGSAGAGFKKWYEYADQNGVTIVGGSSQTVVAGGGWISGAGHSAISNEYGLGVDRVLEMDVVMPNGTYVTASRCQHPDLFYALRGGGGGVFGIATSITFSTVPKLTLQVSYIRFVSLDTNSARRFMQIIIANSLKWADEGWGGYIQPGAMSKQASGLVLMTPKLTNAEAKASMKPLNDYVASLGNIVLNNQVDQVDSFLKAYQTYLLPNDELVGIGTTIASRFVPKDNFRTNSSQTELLNAFMNGMNTAGTNVLPNNSPGLVYGGAPTQILVTAPTNYPNDGTHSATPAWYSTVWHVLYAPTFSYSASASDIKTLWQKATTAADFIRKITPAAAYQNEAYYNEPNYGETFWGTSNFNRLTAYKKQIDPNNLLTCHQCIGWNPSDSRYACYP